MEDMVDTVEAMVDTVEAMVDTVEAMVDTVARGKLRPTMDMALRCQHGQDTVCKYRFRKPDG